MKEKVKFGGRDHPRTRQSLETSAEKYKALLANVQSLPKAFACTTQYTEAGNEKVETTEEAIGMDEYMDL